MVVLFLTVEASEIYTKSFKNMVLVKTPKIGGFVVDRKNIDLLTSIRKASEMRLAQGQGHFDAIMRGGLYEGGVRMGGPNRRLPPS